MLPFLAQAHPQWPKLARLADDASCVASCIAATITLNFYMLNWITGGMVERSEDRPEWLGWTVHAVNTIFAVLDIIVARPRTFSIRARLSAVGLSVVYLAFIVTCRCDPMSAAACADA